MCAMAPYGNSIGGHVADDKRHPAKILMRNGVPFPISTDDPPYTQDMKQEYPSSAMPVVPLIALASGSDISQIALAISSERMIRPFI